MYTEELTAEEFAAYFTAKNINTILLRKDMSGKLICSHNQEHLQDLINAIEAAKEWKNHEAVFIHIDSQTSCIYIVCIHNTKRGRSEGGVRIVNSSQKVLGEFFFIDGLNDCLALSYGMTLKNAYADIWEGGAKSVIIPYNKHIHKQLENERANSEKEYVGLFRELLWRNYSQFIVKMQGVYLIGEDMNLNSWDMRAILKYIVHSSCHDKSVGGAGNPSPQTALGVFKAIQAGAAKIYGGENPLEGKTVLLKGLGQVGIALCKQLLNAGCSVSCYDIKSKEEISLSDIPNEYVELNRFHYHQIKEIAEELEYVNQSDANIFSPNAKSGTLSKDMVNAIINSKSIKLIAGGENAQVARDDKDYVVQTFHENGIIYLPEAAINYMGVFSAYQEHNGILYSDFIRVSEEIYQKTTRLITGDKAPYTIFEDEALKKAKELNPLFKDQGHRSASIIEEICKV
jgi:leucine dehydrogenase